MHKLVFGLALATLISTTSFSVHAITGNATPYPGTEVIATKYSFGQLRTRLESPIKKSGMYVVTTASAGAKHRGIKILGNLVLGVYRNDFAVRMLKASVPSGIEAPLRFYVKENADATATLTYRKPSAIFGVCDSSDLDAMAKELDNLWAKIVSGTTGK
jgi:uncharacterized protein (DUF302 family)